MSAIATKEPTSPPPPWAWIKCLRDITDPSKSKFRRTNDADDVDLPVEILPWLFLADRKSAMNMVKMKELKVSHILSVHCATPREELYYQDRLEGTGIVHHRIHCDDTEGYDMIGKHWEECFTFLEQVKNTPGSRVVVHCVAGINRSGLIVAAAYMIFQQQSLIPAVQHCLDRRGGMLLWNRSFQDQLCRLAQKEHLLGGHPDGYTEEPLIDETPPPPPAHETTLQLSIADIKYRLSSHLTTLIKDRTG